MNNAAQIYRNALANFQREFWDSYYFPIIGKFNIAEMQRLDGIIMNGIIDGDDAALKQEQPAVDVHDAAFVAVEMTLKTHRNISPVAQSAYVLTALSDAGLKIIKK